MVDQHGKDNHRDGEDKMDHILEDHRKGNNTPGKINLFNQRGIPQQDQRGGVDGVGKPLPGKEPRDQEQRVVLHLDSQDDFERDEEDKGKGEGVGDGPKIAQDGVLIPYLDLLLRKNKYQIPVIG